MYSSGSPEGGTDSTGMYQLSYYRMSSIVVWWFLLHACACHWKKEKEKTKIHNNGFAMLWWWNMSVLLFHICDLYNLCFIFTIDHNPKQIDKQIINNNCSPELRNRLKN